MGKEIVLKTAWQTCNIGDICFTPAMLNMLTRTFPDAHITCWGHALNDDILALIHRSFPNISWVKGSLGRSGTPADKAIVDALLAADLFVYNSGPLIMYRGGAQQWDYSIHNMLPLFFCKTHGIPYGIYAQSFELAPPSGMVFSDAFSAADFLFCRDGISVRTLQDAGVKNPTLGFAPDIAFTFAMRDDARADAFLSSAGLVAGNYLSVSTHYAIESRPGVMEKGEFYAAKIREAVTAWVRATGVPVLLFPEDDREVITNRVFIYDKLPADVKKLVRMRDTFWLPDEALSVLARSRAIFSMEPHGMIMAMQHGVPCLHPMIWEFGVKAEMWRDIGIGDWLFDLDTVDTDAMAKTLFAVHERYDDAKALMNKANAVVRERLAAAWGSIAQCKKR